MSTKRQFLFVLAIFALCVFALLLIPSPAMPSAFAHAQIYPHVHPHEAVALLQDFLLNGVWLGLWIVAYRLAKRLWVALAEAVRS